MKAKRVSTFILALILTMGMIIQAYAAEVGSSNSTGNTPVEITAQATTFSVTVPTVLPINVDENNNVTVATDCSIINNSAGPVEVKEAEVISQNGWSLVDFTKDFSTAKVGLKEFGFQLNSSNVSTDGSVSIENFNTINGYGSEPFTYDANIAVQKDALNNVQIAQVVFTVGWVADPGASEPASYPPYLTFESPSSFTLRTDNRAKNWDGTLEYSTDTTTWETWDGTTLTSSGNVLYLRGTNNTMITGNSRNPYNNRWVLNGSDIACSGNIETLLDYATVQAGNHPTMADYCYYMMFNGCTSLIAAPALPATTLTDHCYARMFESCKSITTAPALPADTLAEWCYYSMFDGCTSLTAAPALPVTTLASHCYDNMFHYCTSLTTAPALPATTLAEGCYQGMFGRCSSLITAPALPATTLAKYCYADMFGDCTSLTTAPALPVTTLADYCYRSMFVGCTSLTTVPALPADTLANYCYYSMFKGCTSLTAAPALPATTLASNCYAYMFRGCTSFTTTPALPATTLAEFCYDSMFYGCTSLTAVPALPATTLVDNCYMSMFSNCTSLKLSKTQTGEYTQAYRVPTSGNGTTASGAVSFMFSSTGGTFTSSPNINTIYYLSNTNTIVPAN